MRIDLMDETARAVLEDEVDRYVLGELDDAGRKAFEERMASDDELEEYVAIRRLEVAAVRDRETLKDEFAGIEKSSRKHIRRNWILLSAASVAVAACLVAGLLLRNGFVKEYSAVGLDCINMLAQLPPSRGGLDLSTIIDDIVDADFDKALEEIRKAIEMEPLPIYLQLEGDICYAKQDYASALTSYEKVNQTNLASPATFFNTAKTKEMMKAPAEEVLALMDSCIARCPQPYTEIAAPYLLERAQARMNADQARAALQDYDAYYQVANGKVNDLFFYYREQAALKAKQYQRALDDMAKAIELNPKDLTYRAELAVVNMRVGRNEEALNVLNKALEIDPGYAEGYRLVGIAYLQLKKKNEACKNFQKAKELGDPNVDALIEKHCK